MQTDVGALHDSCSLCVLVNVEEQQGGTALIRRTTGSEGDLSCPAFIQNKSLNFLVFPKVSIAVTILIQFFCKIRVVTGIF